MRFFLLGALFVLAPLVAHAALELPSLGSLLSLNVAPATVGPRAEVTISATSYALDLDRASLVWSIDGTVIDSARNKTSLVTKVGGLGDEVTVSLVAEDASGVIAESETILRPVELELLWESDSYTPPLYRGRALGSPGSHIVASAEARFIRADGERLPPNEIVYSWSWNGRASAEASGRGKSSFRREVTGLYGDDILAVEAASLDGLFRATETARLPAIEPVLTLHPYDPLLNIEYDRALSARDRISSGEATVAAIPYFSFSSGPRDRGVSYHWSIGGHEVSIDAAAPFLLTLSVGESLSGIAALSIVLENSYNILQHVSRAWDITLGSASGDATRGMFPSSAE